MKPTCPIFSTKRLTLRPFEDEDFVSMREMDSDPMVVKYLGSGLVRTEEETIHNLQKIKKDYVEYGLGLYAVELADTGEFIGRSGLIPWMIESSLVWEIGYSFKVSAWNKGYATEAAQFLHDWGFKNLSVPYLISLIHPENKSSILVAEKIGMKYWKDILIGGKNLAAYRVTKKSLK